MGKGWTSCGRVRCRLGRVGSWLEVVIGRGGERGKERCLITPDAKSHGAFRNRDNVRVM